MRLRLPSRSTLCGLSVPPRMAELAVEITVSTPSKAASSEVRSRRSPCTGCAPVSINVSADVARPCWTSCEEGESRRTRIRTSLPDSNNPRAIMPPTTPVAPTTRIILVLLLDCLHRAVRSCSLGALDDTLHGVVDILATLLNRLHIQPPPHDAVL